MEIILIAVPFFFLLIALELWQDRRKNTGYYQFNDALNSLNLGVLSRLTGLFKVLLPLSVYYWVHQHYALWQLPDNSPLVWLAAFVFYDLAYYWIHRLGHEVAIMWGSHVVHHSSEEYNLTTALRQTGTLAVFEWIIVLPLAFIGISTEVMLATVSLNLIYQFWVHTRHIDRMPDWFETIFVTPSHHRVHHALNKEYIDKNYGGVFILWDKIFGSFAAEKQDIQIVYGVSDQLNSWDPIWANLKVYRNLLTDILYTNKFTDKIRTLLKPPGWRAPDMELRFPRNYATSDTLNKFDVPLSTTMKSYLVTQFAIVVALVFALLLAIQERQLSLLSGLFLAVFAMFHCWGISALQEAKSYIRWLEPLRIVSLTGVSTFMLIGTEQKAIFFITTIVIITVNLLWFRYTASIQKQHSHSQSLPDCEAAK